MTERHGIEGRDRVWDHPDLLPDASDLDEPLDFADRWGTSSADLDDPIAAIKRAEADEAAAAGGGAGTDQDDEQGQQRGDNQRGDEQRGDEQGRKQQDRDDSGDDS